MVSNKLDFTKFIAKTKLKTEYYSSDNIIIKSKKSITTDKVFILTEEEFNDRNKLNRDFQETDFARTFRFASACLFRNSNDDMIAAKNNIFSFYISNTSKDTSILPALCLEIPSEEEWNNNFAKNLIVSYKKNMQVVETPMISLGEYPQSAVDIDDSSLLNDLYNNGNLKDELISTGLWYTTNSTKSEMFNEQHNPVFMYKGQKYVRSIVQNPRILSYKRWFKVEPIKFVIDNWEDLPQYINPKGTGKANVIELQSTNVLLGAIPFASNTVRKTFTKPALWQNSLVRAFLNSDKVSNMDGSLNYEAKKNWDFTNSGFLFEAFNLNRKPILEYSISLNEDKIASYAFSGCVSLQKLTIPNHVKEIKEHAFDDCKFKYAYVLKSTQDLVLSSSFPQNISDCQVVLDLDKTKKFITNFDYNYLLPINNIQIICDIVDKLDKAQYTIPVEFLKKIFFYNIQNDFIKNCNIKHFKNEINNIGYVSDVKLLELAYKFGCFSTEKMLDKNGKQTQTTLGQKSSHLLSKMLTDQTVSNYSLTSFLVSVECIPYDKKIDKKFIEFIASTGDRGPWQNVFDILELQEKYVDIVRRIAPNFSEVEKYRINIDDKGCPVKLSWKKAIEKFYLCNKFEGVTEQTKDLADVLARYNSNQEIFDKAVRLRNESIESKMRPHILNERLVETNIYEDIEKIKSQTEKALKDSKNTLDNLFSENFTYEMLNKYDPRNAVIGAYCSCCATLGSSYYGQHIAEATMTQNDVQNLVVKNSKGEIIAKGTMYVNRNFGYAVINEFDLNGLYKYHEVNNDGTYKVDDNSVEEKIRDKIFNTFIRGINAFVEQYNKENYAPILKVTVGMGHNKLKRQCERYKKAKENLKVPPSYSFLDANYEQVILYDAIDMKNKSVQEEVK